MFCPSQKVDMWGGSVLCHHTSCLQTHLLLWLQLLSVFVACSLGNTKPNAVDTMGKQMAKGVKVGSPNQNEPPVTADVSAGAL